MKMHNMNKIANRSFSVESKASYSNNRINENQRGSKLESFNNAKIIKTSFAYSKNSGADFSQKKVEPIAHETAKLERGN